MLLTKDIKLFLKDKYAVLSLVFIALFQSIMIYYSQSDILTRVYLSSIAGIYTFFIKILIIIFTLVFLSNFLQVIYQYSSEKENFLLVRSLPSGIKGSIKSKLLLANLTSILITQPFYWTIVIVNEFDQNMEMRFIYFCSFSLLFISLSITTFSSYYILSRSFYYNNFIPEVKSLLILTIITLLSLLIFASMLIIPIVSTDIDSNIILISSLTLLYIVWLISRYLLNKAYIKVENSET
ncbi:MAG: hypothetical protein PF638_13865 [Candidatus Delongbacteria bacterium]|nr:hypothetical protein [Candidatus Delongbacteria bacterium]